MSNIVCLIDCVSKRMSMSNMYKKILVLVLLPKTMSPTQIIRVLETLSFQYTL